MGMFDELVCEMPLPDGWNTDGEFTFQTKSLGRNLDWYRITKMGILVKEKSEFDEVNFVCVPVPGNPQFINHSGPLNFYEIEDLDDENYIWHEYDAQFLNGVCQYIELVKCERKTRKKRAIFTGDV